ncbi:FAD-binding oxidoreductase [Haematospirillum sp. H1815]|uniref:NAD(P)/FAD-dependent oxidoreductase n=1 Tax=Haematospirillum sp. H1815 TaxID=2723108 RepID=UPI00143BF685|nr:FAD-binding oxidoreductase [Haematospirillum sp. H1815]NKD77940.1 FAD-binding oxidoreductase [Haematospirillum sp. H1815]
MQKFSMSWYAASAHKAAPRPALSESCHVDVCIIGAGITGCSAALHLAQRGYRILVLDAGTVGCGASGRSGGQMIAGYNLGQDRIARLVGEDDARHLWDLCEESLSLTRSLVAEHAIDCDFVNGHVMVGEQSRHASALHALCREWEDGGRKGLELWDHAQTQAHVASPRYTCALYDPGGGHLHPLNYTLGLASAAERAGAVFCEQTPMVSWQDGDPAVVRTPHGQVYARFVLFCGNAYLWGSEPTLARTIMPVGTYIAATEPLGEARARALVPGNEAVADCRFVLNYFRCSRDHRLLYGGRVSYSRLDPPSVSEAMRKNMVDCFPQLADVRIDYAWGGLVAITMNRMPHFGRLAPNVLFAHGFSGHGIALTGLAGKLMAEVIDGQAGRFDVFTRIPHHAFPGGRWMRTPLLVLAMMWRRLCDVL